MNARRQANRGTERNTKYLSYQFKGLKLYESWTGRKDVRQFWRRNPLQKDNQQVVTGMKRMRRKAHYR
jgi:hypothetical protein